MLAHQQAMRLRLPPLTSARIWSARSRSRSTISMMASSSYVNLTWRFCCYHKQERNATGRQPWELGSVWDLGARESGSREGKCGAARMREGCG